MAAHSWGEWRRWVRGGGLKGEAPGESGNGIGRKTEPNPTDRRKPGTKQNLMVDRIYAVLFIRFTGANRHNVTEIIPLVVIMPSIGGQPGHPVQKPQVGLADRAYHGQAVDAILKMAEHRSEDRQAEHSAWKRTG